MATTIDNLLEIIEPAPNLFKALEKRASKLANYKGYGPPDLCYFVKEEKGGLFSKPSTAGYFHFVYGADTSSAASVAAYIRSTLTKSQYEYLFFIPFENADSVLSTKSKTRVTQAIFCIYDIVFHRDVRIEVNFPGKMSVYSLDETLKKDHVSDLEWTCGFVSSVVRSFHSHSGTGIRIFQPLMDKSIYQEFMAAAKLVISKGSVLSFIKRIGFQLGGTNDILQTTVNHLAGEVITYFIKNYFYSECNNFIQSRTTFF